MRKLGNSAAKVIPHAMDDFINSIILYAQKGAADIAVGAPI